MKSKLLSTLGISQSLVVVTAVLSFLAGAAIGIARDWPVGSILLYMVYVFAVALMLHASLAALIRKHNR